MNTTIRRHFLKQMGLCSGALTALPLGKLTALSSRKNDPKLKLGLVTFLWGKDWNLPTLIQNCEETGVLAVELRSTHAHGVEPSLGARERLEVKKRFADSKVTFLGPGSNERFDNPDKAVLKKAIEATKAFVKLSHDCGGTGVKVKPDRFHDGVQREKTIEQIGKSLNELGKFAADYGQEIRLEVHGQCAEIPTIKQIMDIATHPKAVVCWNSNKQDLQGKGLEYNFNLVKKRFGKTAHVRELDDRSYPYEKLIKLFVKMDYDGWVCLECVTEPKNRVKALIRQRELFEKMVASAMKKSS